MFGAFRMFEGRAETGSKSFLEQGKYEDEYVKIDENGQNLEASTLVLQAFDGVYKTVYPFDVASTDYVYPVPGWSER